MKLAFFSDPHQTLPDPEIFSDTDLLLIAGDITCSYKGDLLNQAKYINGTFRKWLDELKCKTLIIAGNHDEVLESHKQWINWPNISAIYLEHSMVNIFGLNIYGFPSTLEFHNWAFNFSEEDLYSKLLEIPKTVDILLSHGMPFGYCDIVPGGKRAGSKSLAAWLDDKENNCPQLKYVVGGHYHSGYGREKMTNGIEIINCSIVDENYEMSRDPIFVEI